MVEHLIYKLRTKQGERGIGVERSEMRTLTVYQLENHSRKGGSERPRERTLCFHRDSLWSKSTFCELGSPRTWTVNSVSSAA
jgi:hypothetical protein